MVFNSIEFLIFLPIVVLLFYVLPQKLRWVMLLAASCTFYMWFVPKYILILLVTIVIDFSAGVLMEKYADRAKLKKTFLVISIVSTLMVLMIFKYLNFLTANLSLLCTQLGIERPGNLLRQLHEKKEFQYENISKGMRLIIYGFFIKMVVADHLGAYVDKVYAEPSAYNSWSVMLAMAFYSFQIYCDFFGYSTIALGAAKLMGFDISDNFRTPYLAKSIAEFWHRWHISLSTWFRDYVYIPLGGSRVKFGRWAFNILVVFVLSGIWHGAAWTFLFWGFAHGLLHIIEKALRNRFPEKEVQSKWLGVGLDALRIAKTFVLVTLFWVMFRATDFANMKGMFVAAVTNFGGGESLGVKPEMWLYLGLFILSDLLLFNSRFDQWCDNKPLVLRWFIYGLLIFMTVACSSVNSFPFIYFQF